MKTWRLAFLPLLVIPACGGDDGSTGTDPDMPDPEQPTSAVPRVEDASCRFEIPAELGLTEGVDVRCGDLVVYENREIKDSETLRLHFVQIDGAASDSATIYLDGGPGGDGNSILSILGRDATVREALLSGGDFLSISQRGTGLSVPALMCDPMNPGAATCAANLGPIADLSQYNTANNADDIEDLRQALGYESFNLYGISYGSRLTLEVLRRHPEHVRAAVAGGTVPANVVWPAETPANFYGALSNLAASCAADSACLESYGDLAATLVQGIVDLNDQPAIVSVFGQQYPLDGYTYAALVFQLLYSRSTYGVLPLVISDLADRRTDRVVDLLLAIFMNQSAAAGQLAQGMYYSVVCGELFNPAPAESVFTDAIEGLPEPIVEALSPTWYQLQSSCSQWPLGRPLPELSALVTSDVPTLISNGRLDPITPPAFGSIAKEGLANALAVSFANSGHGSTLQSPCGVQVLGDFFADPNGTVDASCADEIDIAFEMPSSLAPTAGLDLKRIREDIDRAPTPPWIRDRLADWGPR